MNVVKKLLVLSLLLFNLCHLVFSGRILAVLSSPMKSHQNFFNAVVDTLATQHSITFYTPVIKKQHQNVTYKELDLKNPIQSFSKTFFHHKCNIQHSHEVVIKLAFIENENYYESMFQGKHIQELLKSPPTVKYDLILIASFTSEPFFPLSEKFKAPMIMISPSIIMPWNNIQIGNPNFPNTDLNMLTQDTPESLTTRITKFYQHMKVMYHFTNIYMPMVERITRKYFPSNYSKIENMNKNLALIFVNTNNVLGNVRANLPNVIEIGGLHCKPSKLLDAELNRFISEAENGVVYVSLGGTVMGKDLPVDLKNAFVGAFSKLKQRVLWKWEGEIENLPSNIKVSKWFPQNDILGHENVRLFVSQGGMLSFQEALYHGIPILTIPLICDQYINAYLAQKHGYGRRLSLCHVDERNLLQNILEIINNSTYKNNAMEISDYLNKTNHLPRYNLLQWTEYVMNHRKSPLLNADSREFSMVQLYQLELVLFLVPLLIVIVFIFAFPIIFIYKSFKQDEVDRNVPYKKYQ